MEYPINNEAYQRPCAGSISSGSVDILNGDRHSFLSSSPTPSDSPCLNEIQMTLDETTFNVASVDQLKGSPDAIYSIEDTASETTPTRGLYPAESSYVNFSVIMDQMIKNNRKEIFTSQNNGNHASSIISINGLVRNPENCASVPPMPFGEMRHECNLIFSCSQPSSARSENLAEKIGKSSFRTPSKRLGTTGYLPFSTQRLLEHAADVSEDGLRLANVATRLHLLRRPDFRERLAQTLQRKVDEIFGEICESVIPQKYLPSVDSAHCSTSYERPKSPLEECFPFKELQKADFTTKHCRYSPIENEARSSGALIENTLANQYQLTSSFMTADELLNSTSLEAQSGLDILGALASKEHELSVANSLMKTSTSSPPGQNLGGECSGRISSISSAAPSSKTFICSSNENVFNQLCIKDYSLYKEELENDEAKNDFFSNERTDFCSPSDLEKKCNMLEVICKKEKCNITNGHSRLENDEKWNDESRKECHRYSSSHMLRSTGDYTPSASPINSLRSCFGSSPLSYDKNNHYQSNLSPLQRYNSENNTYRFSSNTNLLHEAARNMISPSDRYSHDKIDAQSYAQVSQRKNSFSCEETCGEFDCESNTNDYIFRNYPNETTVALNSAKKNYEYNCEPSSRNSSNFNDNQKTALQQQTLVPPLKNRYADTRPDCQNVRHALARQENVKPGAASCHNNDQEAESSRFFIGPQVLSAHNGQWKFDHTAVAHIPHPLISSRLSGNVLRNSDPHIFNNDNDNNNVTNNNNSIHNDYAKDPDSTLKQNFAKTLAIPSSAPPIATTYAASIMASIGCSQKSANRGRKPSSNNSSNRNGPMPLSSAMTAGGMRSNNNVHGGSFGLCENGARKVSHLIASSAGSVAMARKNNNISNTRAAMYQRCSTSTLASCTGAPRVCTNCSTSDTPSWRFDDEGLLQCNACALYSKLNNKKRPANLFHLPRPRKKKSK